MISKNHQNLIDQVINFKTGADKDLYQKKIIYDYLSSINKPIILEFGVNTGASSSIFTYVAEKNNGKVYSIDIQDCKDVIASDNWFFLQTKDSLRSTKSKTCFLDFFFRFLYGFFRFFSNFYMFFFRLFSIISTKSIFFFDFYIVFFDFYFVIFVFFSILFLHVSESCSLYTRCNKQIQRVE